MLPLLLQTHAVDVSMITNPKVFTQSVCCHSPAFAAIVLLSFLWQAVLKLLLASGIIYT